MIIFNNKGTSIILLIMIMLITAVLGGAIASFMGAKQKSFPFTVNSYRAYEIANAGVEYAIQYTTDGRTPSISPCSVMPQMSVGFGDGQFTVCYDPLPTDRLTSTGTFGGVTRVVTLGNFSSYTGGYDITFDTDMTDFTRAIVSSSTNAVVVTNTAANKYVTLGGNLNDSFGALWYGGDKAGFCGTSLGIGVPSGACTFGTGFRAYYVFRFDPSSVADGFIFTIANASSNTFGGSDTVNNISGSAGSYRYAVGGDTASGSSLGYAGDSRSGSINLFVDRREGRGIRPPKIGVEFDIYPSSCAAPGNMTFCDLTTPTFRHHVAYVYWGTNTTVTAENVTSYLGWQASSEYLPLRVVQNGSYRYINNSIAGVSGNAAPAWPTGKAATVNDGTVTWLEATWRANTQYNVGEINVPTTWNGYYYTVSATTGNRRTGFFEPSWPATIGATVTNGNVTWRNTGVLSNPGNSPTYDDNAHSTAAYTFGQNPRNDNINMYFTAPREASANWLVTGGPTFAFRIEVARSTAAPYNYIVRSWIKRCTDGTTECNQHTNDRFGNNLSTDYASPWTAGTVYGVGSFVFPRTANGYYYRCTSPGTSFSVEPTWPTVVGSTISEPGGPTWTCEGEVLRNDNAPLLLSAGEHTAFSRFLFGWTEGTGGERQTVTIRKFRLSFRR